MTRPRLLDLFCGAGGAAMGYHRAGFDVVGVDIKHQPRYPFEFVQGDALDFLREHGGEFDAIHASPPCQRFTALRTMPHAKEHPDLVAPTRELLVATGKPYVIENVPGAPLLNPVILCGTAFGLNANGRQLRRHRLFETNVEVGLVSPCNHKPGTVGVYGHSGGHSSRDSTLLSSAAERREAMGIDWMTNAELSQAIPPAYTEFIGRRLMEELR